MGFNGVLRLLIGQKKENVTKSSYYNFFNLLYN